MAHHPSQPGDAAVEAATCSPFTQKPAQCGSLTCFTKYLQFTSEGTSPKSHASERQSSRPDPDCLGPSTHCYRPLVWGPTHRWSLGLVARMARNRDQTSEVRGPAAPILRGPAGAVSTRAGRVRGSPGSDWLPRSGEAGLWAPRFLRPGFRVAAPGAGPRAGARVPASCRPRAAAAGRSHSGSLG